MGKRKTTDEYITQCNDKHNNRYTYPNCVYTGKNNKVKVECSVHGEFSPIAKEHQRGSNCHKCVIESFKKPKYKNSEVLQMLNNLQDNNFDYSNVDYKKHDEKIIIKCKKHDELFKQELSVFLKTKTGCKKCQYEKASISKRLKEKYVIESLSLTHDNKYEYLIKPDFSSSGKIDIKCSKHGWFDQFYLNHYQKKGCPICGNIISKNENIILEFIQSLEVAVDQGNRKILNKKEIDIYIPDLKLGIEYNGLVWHSDKYKAINYHLDKTELAKSNGVRLIHIFEDEWLDKKEIVKSRLLNILGKTPNRIYARKTCVKEVSSKDAMNFLDTNHIQGRVGGKIYLGLYNGAELVSLMTFGSLRKNLGQTSVENHYELLRFCNSLNTTVIGGASKLFKHFILNYNPQNVISYADRRWSEGELYYNLGFDFISKSRPNYFYSKSPFRVRESRFKYRKSELVRLGFDPLKTEKEIMLERNFNRIYDCGTLKFEWRKEQN